MLKKSLLLLVVLSASLLFVVGCSDDEPTKPEPVNEFNLVAEVGDVYFSTYVTGNGASPNISISDLFDLLTDGDATNDPYIVDLRAAADYTDGHIQGANNITMTDLVTKIEDGTIPSDKTIVNVCYSGQTASSATAFMNLIGYEARNLLFGMCGVDTSISKTTGWLTQIESDERTLVSDASTTTETYDFPVLATGKESAEEIIKDRFTSEIAPSWPRIGADDVWDNTSGYFIVNYWPAAEYANPGHIPSAYQFTPKTSLKSDATLNLLPTDETVVVYCYTGQTSAQVATYLTILGYDAKSLLYGVNGFAYNSLAGHKYAGAPTPGQFDAILVKP